MAELETEHNEHEDQEGDPEQAEIDEAEHICSLAELAVYCIGIAEGALFSAGKSPEEINKFITPIRGQVEKHLDALGCIPGDSMNLGCEEDGKAAIARFPMPPDCSICGVITPDCDCET